MRFNPRARVGVDRGRQFLATEFERKALELRVYPTSGCGGF